MEDPDIHTLELVLADRQDRRAEEAAADTLADRARAEVDQARLDLAKLAGPAVVVLAWRLAGVAEDPAGRKVDEDREKTALAVLDRCGMPKLRAHAVAASIVASSGMPAAGHPGWEPAAVGEGEEQGELDPAGVDAQIDSFMAGVRAARDLAGEADA